MPRTGITTTPLTSLTGKGLVGRLEQIVKAAKNGQPVEDSYVELKAELPKDTEKAARQIAGHANAAAADNILWVIGLSEDGTVFGASKTELANWYPSVRRRFDGPAPRLAKSVNILFGRKMVLALMFNTRDFPYVVNRGDGKREVPWRDGNAVRSAHRNELMELLSQRMQLPKMEALNCKVTTVQGRDKTMWRFVVNLELYVTPQPFAKPVVIPTHNCEATLAMPGVVRKMWLTDLRFSHESRPHAEHIRDFVIRKPAPLRISGHAITRRKRTPYGEAFVRVEMVPAGSPVPITVDASTLCRPAHNQRLTY